MTERHATAGTHLSAPAHDAIRVVVVDDSRLFCVALSRMIEEDPRFKVVGVGRDGREAIDLVRKLDPDVVTLDVEMPVMGGIEALRTIVAESTASVIMLSALTESGASVTLQALEIGAIDFIAKVGGQGALHQKLEVAAAVRRRAVRRAKGGPALPVASASRALRATAAKAVRRDLQVGVIGSSTGGPNALAAVLGALPKGLRVPIVVAQHMPPNFTEALAKRLADNCPLRVVHAEDGQQLVPGTVYISPGGSSARILPGALRITFGETGLLYRPSVEVLAASAAEAYGRSVFAVMLTGMGADGAKAFQSIRQLGGHTIAQDQASSVVWGMPRAVVELGAADEVLPLGEIGARIGRLLGAE